MNKARWRESAVEKGTGPSESGDELNLGAYVREARRAKGMRLRHLADSSGLSEGLISKIENNKAMPSLQTLHRLARALGTTVAALLGREPERPGVVMRSGKRPVIGRSAIPGLATDGIDAEVMVPFGSSSVLQGFVMRLQPGASSDGDRQHEGEEVGYVMTGEMLLTVAGVTYTLNAGDSFFFPSRLPHSYSNPCGIVTEIVWVNTPPSI